MPNNRIPKISDYVAYWKSAFEMLKGVKSIDKELSKKYKNFIKDKNFTQNENKLLRELI